MNSLVLIQREIRTSLRLWLALVVGIFAAFHLAQIALLVVRFQTFPNYLVVHDWLGNAARIIRKTPSVTDKISIILDEWWIEIGSMNFAYGHGVSEWSFVLLPSKAATLFVIALLLATNIVLLRAARNSCPLSVRLGASTVAGGATVLAGLSMMTITWVVCCAAPTWVVGLAVAGVSVATAFAIAPIGGWLTLFGIVSLVALAFALVGSLTEQIRGTGASTPINFARMPS
jgi:hypothetical protein